MASARLGQLQQGYPRQPGYPQQGPQQQGWLATPTTGPLPGPGGGYARTSGYRGNDYGNDYQTDAGQDVADAVLGAAAGLIGRAIGRRVQRTWNDRVAPAMAANAETMLRQQIAIAEKYPDLRACMTDKVIFLAGGRRVLPMSSMGSQLTVELADQLVAQLRG